MTTKTRHPRRPRATLQPGGAVSPPNCGSGANRPGWRSARRAGKLEWCSAKISRIENARVSILPRDVKLLLGIYGVHDSAEREVLLALARQSRLKPWWHHDGVTVPDLFQPYAALEAEAAILRS